MVKATLGDQYTAHVDQRVLPKGKTLNLFADDSVIGKFCAGDRLDLPAVTVWRTYRGRADCENRIKELKYDFAADSFNPKNCSWSAYEFDASGVTQKQKNNLESGFGNAAANLDAGLVGRIKIFRFARQIYAHLRTFISGYGKSRFMQDSG